MSRRKQQRRNGRAFTLIEVLVVVGIIALLIAVLLPSLSRAREQARKARCLANLKAIGVAAEAYLMCERDRFCWGLVYPPAPTPWDVTKHEPYHLRTWYFGGNRGKGSDVLGTGGYLNYASDLNWSAEQRPLNRYVYGTLRLGESSDLAVYRCPSDKGVQWDDASFIANSGGVTAYDEIGTSYQANHCWRYFSENWEGDDPARRYLLVDRIIQMMRKHAASSFMLVFEDPASNILAKALDKPFKPALQQQHLGWHGEVDVHNVLFLDGHAAATRIDYLKNLPEVGSGTGLWRARHDYMQN